MAEEEKKVSLFREKSLEAIQSPESLNDYLKVTSPGVWLVLGAVVVLLIGAIIWSIFGRITGTVDVAVVSEGEKCVCIIPYESLEKVVENGSVTVNDIEYRLDAEADFETMIITEDTSPYIRVRGNLELGDVTVVIPLNAKLAEGVYGGVAVTDSLRPISLLLQ